MPLLERTSRLTTLTDAGEALLRPARDLLAAADRLQTVAQSRGRVTVAFVASTTLGYAAAVAPHAEIVQMAVARVAPALRRGDVDLAITRPLPASTTSSSSRSPKKPYIAVPATHPLAARGSIRCAELDGEVFIAQERRFWPEGYDLARERLRERGCVASETRHTTGIPRRAGAGRRGRRRAPDRRPGPRADRGRRLPRARGPDRAGRARAPPRAAPPRGRRAHSQPFCSARLSASMREWAPSFW